MNLNISLLLNLKHLHSGLFSGEGLVELFELLSLNSSGPSSQIGRREVV